MKSALLLILFLSINLFPQSNGGELFSKEYANDNFGKVEYSHEMSIEDFGSLINVNNTDKFMFTLKNKELNVADSFRNILLGNKSLRYDEPMISYNMDLVRNLYNKALEMGVRTISFEQRTGVKKIDAFTSYNILSIDFGDVGVLEMGAFCPPWCN